MHYSTTFSSSMSVSNASINKMSVFLLNALALHMIGYLFKQEKVALY